MKHPPERHWYLVSYDVADDKRRAKVAKCLEGFGERLQYSVFRAFLSIRALSRLRWELSRKMAKEDGLLVIHLCPQCQARVEDQRGRRDWRDEAPLGFRIAGLPLKHPLLDVTTAPSDSMEMGQNVKKTRKRSMKTDNPTGDRQ